MAPRRRAAAEQAPAENWDRREPEADDNSGQSHDENAGNGEDEAAEEARAADEADPAEEGGDAPDEDLEADLAAMSTVDHDAGDGLAQPGALSDRQRVGLDPVDQEQHAREADDRSGLTNMQTAHEAAGALDPWSGTPNPGVTETVRHSAPGKAGASDMSGRKPLPDPLAGLAPQQREAMGKLGEASKAAHDRGRPQGQGWLSLQQLGVHKSVMDALVLSKAVDQDVRPGGQFSPETGTVYRIAGHDE
jgi:hypothetical protein